MALKEITLANFYSGLSENHYFGAEKGQFQYAENVDCQAEPRGMRLVAKQTESSFEFNGTTGDCTLIQDLGDWFTDASGWIHVIGNQLFLNGNYVASVSTGVKGWNKIKLSGSNNNFVVLFGNSSVDIYNVSTGVYTAGAGSFTASGNGYRPTISREADVLVGIGDRVMKVVLASATTVTLTQGFLEVVQREDIVALSRYSSEYRVYARTGTSGGGKQYSWDGATNAITSFVNWENSAPLAVANAGPYDYVLAGKNEEFTDLYLATGSEHKLVRSGLVGGKGKRFFPRLKMAKDIVYIMGTIDITKKGETADRKLCIYSYGAENAGFPKGLQLECVIPTVPGEEQAYSNLYASDDYLYFVQGTNATTRAKQFSIQKRRDISTDYTAQGSWISNTITGGVIWTKKNIRQIVVSHSFDTELGHGGSIEVLARNKTYGEFTTLATITSGDFTKIFENELPIATFHEMEIQFILRASEDGERTPFLYEATIIYEDNLKA